MVKPSAASKQDRKDTTASKKGGTSKEDKDSSKRPSTKGNNARPRSQSEKRGDDDEKTDHSHPVEGRGEAVDKSKPNKSAAMSSRLNEDELRKDLMTWVKSVPLSDRCFTKLERAFSDGTLLHELIHYYCPEVAERRPVSRWYSKSNKENAWYHINRVMFPKLGFRLTSAQIDNLVRPYGCGKYQKNCQSGLFIYPLLERVRKALASRCPNVYDYRNSNFVPPTCEKKKYSRKLVNALEHPSYSRVEMLLDKGFYEEDEVCRRYCHKPPRPCEPCCPVYTENTPYPLCGRVQSCCGQLNSGCASSYDWVEFIPQHQSCICFYP